MKIADSDSLRTPFAPAVSAALALERIYRDVLHDGDEFMRSAANDALLSLARLSSYYPSSYLVEAIAARIGILATETIESEAIKTVVATWSDLGKVAFTVGQRPERRAIVEEMGNLCVKLSSLTGRSEDASFCVDRYTEMLAAAMYADYFASDEVIGGCEKIKWVAQNAREPGAKLTALTCLLEIGAAAFEHRRYFIAYRTLSVIASAGASFDSAVEFFRRPEVARRIDFKNRLAGEAFGEDIEAGVVRYHEWAQSLQGLPD